MSCKMVAIASIRHDSSMRFHRLRRRKKERERERHDMIGHGGVMNQMKCMLSLQTIDAILWTDSCYPFTPDPIKLEEESA
ncbi:unnamed protein product [Protopolystoma xenopodis]|uniref:Uncharacterized protein n=1 Tax=Protopolystoma xenopodis TaxID=117903 RepID=A0A448WQF1_9PLAT|nr:unnamed protein product [Protopolystoma xenopodis]